MTFSDPEHIPLPDEADAEEESPYRRRQKAVEVRRKRFPGRARRLLRWTLFGVFVLLPGGYVGYQATNFALISPRFRLSSAEDIVVKGNVFVSREEILNALGIALAGTPGAGVNIFRLSLEDKKKQVESIPWVWSATLTRAYPHRLAVRVVERAPVAFVNIGGRVKLVDEEGVLLEKPEKADFDFPVLAGLDAAGGVAERQSRLALYQEFARQLAGEAPSSGWLISEVDVTDPDDLKALLVQGNETILVHFGHRDFLERFRNFLTFLPEVRKTNTKIDSVDLRYRNQVVVNPQPASPQNPERSDTQKE